MKLEILNLHKVRLGTSEEGLKNFTNAVVKLKNLKDLSLKFAGIGNSEIAILAPAMEGLEKLETLIAYFQMLWDLK